jgi:hypothetical protein
MMKPLASALSRAGRRLEGGDGGDGSNQCIM